MQISPISGLSTVLSSLFVEAGKIITFMNVGRQGDYIAIRGRGDTPEEDRKIQDAVNQLKNKGYGSFKGAFTKLIKTLDDLNSVKAELDYISSTTGVPADYKGLDIIRAKLEKPAPVAPSDAPAATDPTVPTGTTPAQTIENMRDKIKDDLAKAPSGERSDVVGKIIDKYLDDLVKEVDIAKQQDFIKRFFEFSSKFWKYSFANQMLIWLQTQGKATSVAGYNDWRDKYGRQVQSGAKQIKIFAPMLKKVKTEAGDEEQRCVGFLLVGVFDLSDTKPLEGETLAKWQAKNPGKQPFEPASKDWWMSKGTEDTERTIPLRNAAILFANEKGIDVTTSEDTGEAGGYASGNHISVHYESSGERQLSTIVHELAHELLHWAARRKDPGTADIQTGPRMDLEVDAESVAYIVMKHFGFNTEYAPNYLALSGATGADIRKRRDNISRAVKQIIEGIMKNIESGNRLATPIPPVQAMQKWVHRNCRFAAEMEGWAGALLDTSPGYTGGDYSSPEESESNKNLPTTIDKFHKEILPKMLQNIKDPNLIRELELYYTQGKRLTEEVQRAIKNKQIQQPESDEAALMPTVV